MEYFIDLINNIKEDYRNIRLIKNTLILLLIKGGSIVISLITLPVYMKYFENIELLGFWFTAISVLSWVFVFDLGIGNGLRNKLVGPLVNKNSNQIKKYISSAYIMIGVFVIFITLIGYFLFPYVSWNKVFNISNRLISQKVLIDVLRIMFIGIMLQFFLKLQSSIFLALQKPAIPDFINLLSRLILLLSILILIYNNLSGNIWLLSIVYVLTANLLFVISSFFLFLTALKNSKPKISFFRKSYASEIISLGGIFFWLQIMFLLISNTNEFLINLFVGAAEVVDYKIYYSIFGVVSSLFLLALKPIWSEVTEASKKNDYKWIDKLFTRLNKLVLVVLICEMVLIFTLQPLVNIWLKDKAIQINLWYAAVFGISGTVIVWNAVISNFINGLSKLKLAMKLLAFGAVINVPIAYLGTQLLDSWIGIVLANIISLLPFCIIQSCWLRNYLDGKIEVYQM